MVFICSLMTEDPNLGHLRGALLGKCHCCQLRIWYAASTKKYMMDERFNCTLLCQKCFKTDSHPGKWSGLAIGAKKELFAEGMSEEEIDLALELKKNELYLKEGH